MGLDLAGNHKYLLLMRTVIEEVLNVLWFIGVFSVYFIACHFIAKWGTRLMLPYRRVFLLSIPFLPYTFLWMLLRSYRFRQAIK